MARKMIIMAALAATMVTAVTPAGAMAQSYDYGRDGYYQRQDRHADWNHRDGRDYRGVRYEDNRYRSGYRGYDRPGYHNDHNAYDDRATYRCRNDGTTGTLIGAIAGGLLGNGIAERGDRTLGTILGGGAGALAGRAIDRSDSRC